MKRKKIYGIFMLVAIAVFLFAGGRILQIYLNYQESQKVYKQMEGFTQKIEDQDLSPEAVPGETTGEVVEQGFLQVDFNKLEEINPDVIAWIEIPGLEISYPVVQGRDNDYYLHHLITGENHKSGSIFMDFHNQENLSDRNSIIYGHNMKDGSMFGTLDQYQSQALYRKRFCENQKIKLESIFTDKITGKNFDRPRYTVLVEDVLRVGDTLIITELDRLGRNKQEILKQLRFLEEKGVRVMVLELPTTLFDLSQMENNLAKMMIETINNMMIELYASMAQAEMEKKEKRQKEGMEAKRLRGEWDEVGRPRAIEQEKFNQEFMRVVQKKVTPTQLQRELGLTSSTYYRYRKNFYEIFPEFLQSV